jgi:hypothetical protein
MSKHTPEQIQYVADTIMPGFIPRDVTASELNFAFTMDGVNYEVVYQKDKQGNWQFSSHRKADS